MIRADELNVALATLYLRLSGYFTTGLILHAQRKGGQNKGEIDCFAVRHHLHDQMARGVASPEFLGIGTDQIDVILCEVKSKAPRFNKSIQTQDNLCDALRWAGVLPEDRISSVAQQLIPLMKEGADKDLARKGVTNGHVRVRALLCAPPLAESDVASWCLTGTELFRYLHLCLDPSQAPPSCSRRYAYDLWGTSYAPIVEWFKRKRREEPITLQALYDYLNPKSTGQGQPKSA